MTDTTRTGRPKRTSAQAGSVTSTRDGPSGMATSEYVRQTRRSRPRSHRRHPLRDAWSGIVVAGGSRSGSSARSAHPASGCQAHRDDRPRRDDFRDRRPARDPGRDRDATGLPVVRRLQEGRPFSRATTSCAALVMSDVVKVLDTPPPITFTNVTFPRASRSASSAAADKVPSSRPTEFLHGRQLGPAALKY